MVNSQIHRVFIHMPQIAQVDARVPIELIDLRPVDSTNPVRREGTSGGLADLRARSQAWHQ